MKSRVIVFIILSPLWFAGCQPPETGPGPKPKPPAAKPARPDPKTAAVIERVEQLDGKVELDDSGNVTAIDLPKGKGSNDDVKLFASLPSLRRLN